MADPKAQAMSKVDMPLASMIRLFWFGAWLGELSKNHVFHNQCGLLGRALSARINRNSSYEFESHSLRRPSADSPEERKPARFRAFALSR